MSDLLNVKLQEVRANRSNYLRYKGRDGEYHYIDSLPTPDTDAVGVTWAQLKGMRDSGKLEIGQFYRITDYATTTAQENTRSAGHQFDVVVMALDSKTLAERAWAMPHKGDTYFKDSKLEAWKLCYSLDNDVKRFAWADSGSPAKIVVDANGNSVEAVRDAEEDILARELFAWTAEGNTRYYTTTEIPQGGDKVYDSDKTPVTSTEVDSYIAPTTEGKGVIWRMVDEFNNDAPYDFKNIQFKRFELLANNMVWDNAHANQSLVSLYQELLGSSGVQSHKFGHCTSQYEGSEFDFDDASGAIDGDAMYISLDDPEWENDIYVICKIDPAKFGWFFTFDNDGDDASFGGGVYNNVFGAFKNEDDLYALNNNIAFANKFFAVIMGANNYSMSFGNNNGSMSFGNYCNSMNFGNDNRSMSFGNYIYSMSFGNENFSMSFGNNNRSMSFGNNNGSMSFGNGCYGLNFGNNNRSMSFGNGVNNVTFAKDYTRFVIVEDGNQNITLTSNKTTGPSSYLQNIFIGLGVNNGNDPLTISHNSVNDTFKTTYQSEDSVTVNVEDL